MKTRYPGFQQWYRLRQPRCDALPYHAQTLHLWPAAPPPPAPVPASPDPLDYGRVARGRYSGTLS
jgi:hypothetical protein